MNKEAPVGYLALVRNGDALSTCSVSSPTYLPTYIHLFLPTSHAMLLGQKSSQIISNILSSMNTITFAQFTFIFTPDQERWVPANSGTLRHTIPSGADHPLQRGR
jgi:hypothetical protein